MCSLQSVGWQHCIIQQLADKMRLEATFRVVVLRVHKSFPQTSANYVKYPSSLLHTCSTLDHALRKALLAPSVQTDIENMWCHALTSLHDCKTYDVYIYKYDIHDTTS